MFSIKRANYVNNLFDEDVLLLFSNFLLDNVPPEKVITAGGQRSKFYLNDCHSLI